MGVLLREVIGVQLQEAVDGEGSRSGGNIELLDEWSLVCGAMDEGRVRNEGQGQGDVLGVIDTIEAIIRRKGLHALRRIAGEHEMYRKPTQRRLLGISKAHTIRQTARKMRPQDVGNVSIQGLNVWNGV